MTDRPLSPISPRTLKAAGRLDWWWNSARLITLCSASADQGVPVAPVNGNCPLHGGDACLFVFAAVSDITQALREGGIGVE